MISFKRSNKLYTKKNVDNFLLEYINEGSDKKKYNSNLLLLEEALEKLSEEDRDLLLLRGQNFSYNEIAEFLKIENNQLKVKFHRAKKKLLQQIDKIILENHEQEK